MENKIRHLEMIQGVINRMANNSFYIKGWTVTLVSAIFMFADNKNDIMFMALAYFPIIVFGLLDAYYLALEKQFRDLYNKVRKIEDDKINFDMTPEKGLPCKYFQAIISPSIGPFYLIILAIIRLIVINM